MLFFSTWKNHLKHNSSAPAERSRCASRPHEGWQTGCRGSTSSRPCFLADGSGWVDVHRPHRMMAKSPLCHPSMAIAASREASWIRLTGSLQGSKDRCGRNDDLAAVTAIRHSQTRQSHGRRPTCIVVIPEMDDEDCPHRHCAVHIGQARHSLDELALPQAERCSV